MSYSYTDRVGDGTTRTFSFGFTGEDKGYISANDIKVYTSTDGITYQIVSGYTLSGTNQITFLTAPADGLLLRIRRVVDRTKPYAKFDRSVTLDMLSLNNSFIQMLEVIHEILDGFYDDTFYFKQDINMGGHKLTNLGAGTNPSDAATFGQLSDIDLKHTQWNTAQDVQINGLRAAMSADTAHRTIPWLYTATGGETTISPPFVFTDAFVIIQGAFQFQLDGAYSIANNQITFPSPLQAGWKVLCLLGSRMATPVTGGQVDTATIAANEGVTSIPLSFGVTSIVEVDLDGLTQTPSAYSLSVDKSTLNFTEALPACTVLIKYIQ